MAKSISVKKTLFYLLFFCGVVLILSHITKKDDSVKEQFIQSTEKQKYPVKKDYHLGHK